jgi:hypothetical protein
LALALIPHEICGEFAFHQLTVLLGFGRHEFTLHPRSKGTQQVDSFLEFPRCLASLCVIISQKCSARICLTILLLNFDSNAQPTRSPLEATILTHIPRIQLIDFYLSCANGLDLVVCSRNGHREQAFLSGMLSIGRSARGDPASFRSKPCTLSRRCRMFVAQLLQDLLFWK